MRHLCWSCTKRVHVELLDGRSSTMRALAGWVGSWAVVGRRHALALGLAAMLCAGLMAPAVQAGVTRVKPTGDDTKNGQSWDDAKRTVAGGLTAAVSGDEVWVAAGTYVERITLKAGVGLYGGFAGGEAQRTDRNWVTNVTILDGNSGGCVVTAPAWATASTRIDGFTIQNGNAGSGGGLNVVNSAPTIANNLITNNRALTKGAGIYSSAPANNQIPTIINNRIIGNTAGTLTALGSTGDGGGVYVAFKAVIANNMIVGNSAGRYGAGIYCLSSSATIANNTVVGNMAGNYGGGVYTTSSNSLTFSNNIVAFNSTEIFNASGTPTLQNNCVYSPTGSAYTGLSPGSGDITADPQLLGVDDAEVHLKASSPCIGAGLDSVVQGSWVDMDGEARVLGTHVDVGADEFDGIEPAFTPRVVRVSASGDDANDGSRWDLAKRTVQAGINAAATTGGEVWVAAGTYGERITLKAWVQVYGGFAGTETQRSERDWTNHVTILDGGAGGKVVSALAGSGLCGIDGFTIRNGNAGTSGGGGLYCTVCMPRISNNLITANTASYGGGICSDFGAATVISDNTIQANIAGGDTSDQAQGGGIYCRSDAVIRRNRITDNVAGGDDRYGEGGGIHCRSSGLTITGNLIARNAARYVSYYEGDGGGIYCNSGGSSPSGNVPPVISNNVIERNTAGAGSAIFCTQSCSAIVANNLIAANIATSNSQSYCGGICINTGCTPTIANNTLVYNYSPRGGGIYCVATVSSTISNNLVAFNKGGIYGGTPTLRNNCFYNPAGADYTNVSPGIGDISADPQFLAADYGDFHLRSGSPCIDAGDNSVVQSGWVDIDGQTRLQGTKVDIGADESKGTTPPYSIPVVRVSPFGNDANDGLSWESAKRTVQAAIDTAAATSGDVWVAAGTYDERIDVKPWVHVYGGFAGTEIARDERNWSSNVTVLDGGAEGSVVSMVSGGVCRIDGFTIRNGTGSPDPIYGGLCGGGIYCVYTSPIIVNNTITGNSVEGGVGGGISCVFANSMTISGNTVSGNTAYSAAAIRCDYVAGNISGNVVTQNTGGAPISLSIYFVDSSGIISNNLITQNATGGIGSWESSCSIVENTIVGNAGLGIRFDQGGSGTVQNCLIAQNTNSGIYCNGLSPVILDSRIEGNTASMGAGINCLYSTATLSNVAFVGNRASYRGPGIYCSNSSPTLTNCTFVGHSALSGGLLYVDSGQPSLVNCISWDHGNDPIHINSGGATLSYCDVQGGWSGTGNIDLDPNFVRAPSPGADGVWGTADDDYGDLRLMAGSPCIDAGNNAAVPAGILTDLGGLARFLDDPATADCPFAPGTCGTAPIVDMGAYEFMAGDYDGDGDVDGDDLALFAACISGPAVGYEGDCGKADFDHDGDVDLADFGQFQRCRGAAKGAGAGN